MDNILELNNVTKTFDEFCLNHINLVLPKGCIMGYIGENGAGKSTSIKAILGMVNLDCGEIRVFGKDIHHESGLWKERIGVVLADSMFPENLNIKEINNVLNKIYHQWESNIFFQYVNRFELPTKKIIKSFSRGMKMKLNIAIALSHHAQLLILDEATSGLDPIVREEILEILLDFIQDEECSVLISSHITSDIEKCCDYVTFLHKGELLLCEEKDELLARYGILRIDEASFHTLHSDDYVAYRKSQYSIDVLITNTDEIHKRMPEAVIDPANLEDIMLFIVKGEH